MEFLSYQVHSLLTELTNSVRKWVTNKWSQYPLCLCVAWLQVILLSGENLPVSSKLQVEIEHAIQSQGNKVKKLADLLLKKTREKGGKCQSNILKLLGDRREVYTFNIYV